MHFGFCTDDTVMRRRTWQLVCPASSAEDDVDPPEGGTYHDIETALSWTSGICWIEVMPTVCHARSTCLPLDGRRKTGHRLGSIE